MKKKIGKRVASMALVTCMLVPSQIPTCVVFADTTKNEQSSLPENILEDKKCFDTIASIADKYAKMFEGDSRYGGPLAYKEKIDGSKTLKRINFVQPETPIEVDGSITIDVPADIASIVRIFGGFRYTGSIAEAGKSKMYLIDPDGTEHLMTNNGNAWSGEFLDENKEKLWTTHGKFSGCGSNLVHPTEHKNAEGKVSYEGYKLRFEGTGKINFIYVFTDAGLPREYDTSAYEVIDKDKDIADVKLHFDATDNLSINGVNKMDEETYKRFHANVTAWTGSDSEDYSLDENVFSKTYRDWGFLPSRSSLQISRVATGIKEDEKNPGYSDMTEVNKNFKYDEVQTNKMNTLYPTLGNNYAITLDAWPKWQWGTGKYLEYNNKNPNFGAPDAEHFDAAAKTAADVIGALNTKLGDQAPKYVEVKNEITFQGEWPYFFTDTYDNAWSYMADFHNKVADAIKEESPNTLVGGPSSAFMNLEKNNFRDANKQIEFLDNTKGHLDWYSHHFYETSGTLFVNDNENNSTGYLCGRYEAVMDLLRSHMANTDNIKPFVITETGTYTSDKTFVGYFEALTAFNGYLMRHIDYADSIDLYVPYLYPIKIWEDSAIHQLYKLNASKNGIEEEMTPLEAYVDMWKDFRGSYIPVSIEANDNLVKNRVYTTATRVGDKVYLAVQNLNHQRINIDMEEVLGTDINIDSVSQKHYYLENGELVYKEEPVADYNNVYMRTQEMSMFEIDLSKAPTFDNTLLRTFDYAKEELVDTGSNMNFTIKTSTKDINKSKIRVGFGKSNSGFMVDGSQMSVNINGQDVAVQSLEYTKKSGDLLTNIEFDVDKSYLLNGNNTVKISMPTGGKVTSVQLINYYNTDKPEGVLADTLNEKIKTAESKVDNSLAISVNGSELKEGTKWIRQIDQDSYKNAIKHAKIIAQDDNLLQSEVDLQVKALDTAMKMYNVNQKTKEAEVVLKPTFPTIDFEDGKQHLTADAGVDMNVVDNGINGKSLKINYGKDGFETSYNWSKTSTLLFTEPAVVGKNNKIKFTVKNPQDYQIQVRCNITDEKGAVRTFYSYIPANSTKEVIISDFSAGNSSTSGADGWYGAETTGLDVNKIKSMKLLVFDKDKRDTTIFVDDIGLDIEEVKETIFPEFNFEDNNAKFTSTASTIEIVDDSFAGNNSKKALKVSTKGEKYSGKVTPASTYTFEEPVKIAEDGQLSMMIKNPNDFAIQVRVTLKDLENHARTYFISLQANQTENFIISEFGAVPDQYSGATGYFGAATTGIDKNSISSISLCQYDAATDKVDTSFIIDNIKVASDGKEDEKAVAAVEEKINAIGTVTLNSKAAIETARKAYEALTDEQKKLISEDTLKVLTDAQSKYLELAIAESDQAKAEAEKAKAEAEKAKAEAEKAKAEAEKAKAEADKLKAEAEKATAEAEKIKAEAEKAKAEADKLKAEADKATAEAEKAKAEAATATAEAEKAKAEAEKAKAEADKIIEEAKKAEEIRNNTPSMVTGVSVSNKTMTSISIKWSKDSKATAYEIYRATSKNGTYSKIATVSKDLLSYTNTKLTAGKTYYYKVKATNGKYVGEISNYTYATVAPYQTKSVYVHNYGRNAFKIGWAKQSGVSGYRVYKSTTRSGKYERIATIKGDSNTTFIDKNVKSGTTYYYKVRAYKTVSGKMIFGEYSGIKYRKR